MVQDAHTEGGEFELMATFKKEGEDWCLIEVEDVPMPGYKDEDKESDHEDGGEFGKAYRGAMEGGGGITSTSNY